MAQVTQELVTKFAFQGNLGKLDDFNAGLGKAITALGAVAAAAGAAGGALFAFVSSTTANLDPMVQLSRETGVAMENIQTLGFAASQSGSSAEALQSSLRGLSQRLGEAANGTGEGVDVFKRLGIQLRDSSGEIRNVDDVMDDLRQSMGGLSSAERISVANKLGIDASLVQLLSSTDEQIAGLTERARELGVVTEEQGDAAASFNDALTVLKFGMDSIRNTIAVGFAPQMQELVERFTEFLIANRELFERGITLVADGIMMLLDMFGRLAPILAVAAGAFALVALASGGFAAIIAALISPVVLIAAGIAALLLIVDDLIVAFEGGDSIIRSFFQNFFDIDITPILQNIVSSFMNMVDGIMAAFIPLGEAISSLFSGIMALLTGDFSGFIEGIKGFFAGLFEYIITGWTAVIGFFGDMINMAFPDIVANIKSFFGEAFEWITDKIDGVVNAFKAVGEFFSFGDDELTVGPAAGDTGLRPGPQGGGGQTSNNVTQDIKIDVTSSDPQEAGVQVRNQLQEQLRDAQTQFSRGGR